MPSPVLFLKSLWNVHLPLLPRPPAYFRTWPVPILSPRRGFSFCFWMCPLFPSLFLCLKSLEWLAINCDSDTSPLRCPKPEESTQVVPDRGTSHFERHTIILDWHFKMYSKLFLSFQTAWVWFRYQVQTWRYYSMYCLKRGFRINTKARIINKYQMNKEIPTTSFSN